MRVGITLECTDCKNRNYSTPKIVERRRIAWNSKSFASRASVNFTPGDPLTLNVCLAYDR